MKKAILILIVVIAICMTACSAKTLKVNAQLPQATYLIDDIIIDDVCSSLEKNGLKKTEVYKTWVKDFSDTSAKKTDLTKQWTRLSELKGDLYACSDYWEKTHDYSDANCRMTAMLLMGDLRKGIMTERI